MKKRTCKNCSVPLTAPAEPEAGQWIVRSFNCGDKNIIAIVRRRRRSSRSLDGGSDLGESGGYPPPQVLAVPENAFRVLDGAVVDDPLEQHDDIDVRSGGRFFRIIR